VAKVENPKMYDADVQTDPPVVWPLKNIWETLGMGTFRGPICGQVQNDVSTQTYIQPTSFGLSTPFRLRALVCTRETQTEMGQWEFDQAMEHYRRHQQAQDLAQMAAVAVRARLRSRAAH